MPRYDFDLFTIGAGSGGVAASRRAGSYGARVAGIEAAITSNEALDLPHLPRRIIIVGGGYIAVEFAGIFAGLGTAVTLVIRGEELLNGFDDDVRVALAMEMRARGVEILARTE